MDRCAAILTIPLPIPYVMMLGLTPVDAASTGFSVLGAMPNAGDQARVRELEAELDGLSKIVTERFEELALIHELTDRLNLDVDLATICNSLLGQLALCIGSETIAIELFGHEDSGLKSQLFYVGKPFDTAWVRQLENTNETDSAVSISNLARTPNGRSMRVATVRIDHQQLTLGRMIALREGDQSELGTIEADLMKSTSMMLGMHIANQRQYIEMQQMFEGTIQSLVSALDAKDAYTCGHSTRVSELAVELATQLGYDEEQTNTIRMAGILHDIGKIGVDDSVLRKPGKLTDEEFEQIKQHPVLGYEILRGIRRFRNILPAVRHHHEAWDGSGYPDGLIGNAIPRDAQIIAVADAFDAMTSDRPYRPGMSLERVIEIFGKGKDSQWAADVVDVLLDAPELMQRYARKEFELPKS